MRIIIKDLLVNELKRQYSLLTYIDKVQLALDELSIEPTDAINKDEFYNNWISQIDIDLEIEKYLRWDNNWNKNDDDVLNMYVDAILGNILAESLYSYIEENNIDTKDRWSDNED